MASGTKSPVRRAVLPVGGRGTRMYPATAAVPKELLPIGNRPILEFALEEIAAAGIEEIVLVTAKGKSAIEDFVEDWTARRAPRTRVAYVRQRSPKGLGDAILCAQHLVADASFAVLLPDDVLHGHPSSLQLLIEAHRETQRASVLLQPISDEETRSYGVARIASDAGGRLWIDDLLEKPGPERAPSRFGVVGRYVLPPRIFDCLRAITPGSGGELQLTDGLARLAHVDNLVGVAMEQERIDCGSLAGFLAAQSLLADQADAGGVRVPTRGSSRPASPSRGHAMGDDASSPVQAGERVAVAKRAVLETQK